MRRTLAALAVAAVASMVAVSASAAAAPAPRITFKPDGDGWYAIAATPAAPVRVSLRYGSDCDFIRGQCKSWALLGTKVLPKGAPGRVSWLQASFWGQKPGRHGDVLRSGFYRMSMQVPGSKASALEIAWRLGFGAD